MEDATRKRKSLVFYKSTAFLLSRSVQTRLIIKKVPVSSSLLTTRSVNSSTGSSMNQTLLQCQRITYEAAKSGFQSTNCVASNTVLPDQLLLSFCSQLSDNRHLWDDLQFRCYQWLTSWDGGMFGAMKTGGDAQRKSLLPTRSSMEPEASSQWNDVSLLI